MISLIFRPASLKLIANGFCSKLLSKTSNTVTTVLENQLKTMQQLEDLTHYFSVLSINMESEATQVSHILRLVSSIPEAMKELHNISEGVGRIEQISRGKLSVPLGHILNLGAPLRKTHFPLQIGSPIFQPRCRYPVYMNFWF